jgi:hypothetical protein
MKNGPKMPTMNNPIDPVEFANNFNNLVAVGSPLLGSEVLSGKSASPSHLEVSL